MTLEVSGLFRSKPQSVLRVSAMQRSMTPNGIGSTNLGRGSEDRLYHSCTMWPTIVCVRHGLEFSTAQTR